jgi:hypothetical protein
MEMADSTAPLDIISNSSKSDQLIPNKYEYE